MPLCPRTFWEESDCRIRAIIFHKYLAFTIKISCHSIFAFRGVSEFGPKKQHPQSTIHNTNEENEDIHQDVDR